MMELHGERRLAAPRQRVWDLLNDPAALKECLRGCERLEKTSDSTFAATIAAKVGPIKTTFVGSVALSELDPPSAYTIAFEGKGGAAGFAKGKARVRLRDEAPGTLLTYTVDASLGGKLGQMGSRVVDGVAREMADEFFGRFSELVVPPPPSAPAEPAAAPAASAEAPRSRSALRPLMIAAALIALAVVAWLLLR